MSRSCVVCHGQGCLQLTCNGCGGSGKRGKNTCGVCSGMGWVLVTCQACGGSGAA